MLFKKAGNRLETQKPQGTSLTNSLVRPQEFCVPWPQEQAREQVAKYAQEADCHYCDLRPLVLGDAGMQKLNGDRE